MNRACRDDYGPGARAATIHDILLAQSPADSWLAPGSLPMTVAQTSFGGESVAMDASTGYAVGPAAPDAFLALTKAYCNRYTVNGSDDQAGVVVRFGAIGATFCARVFPAGCAAPVAIPVQ